MYGINHKYHSLMYNLSSLQVVQVLMVKKLAVTVISEVVVEVIIETLISVNQVVEIYNHKQTNQQSQNTTTCKRSNG